MDKYTTEEGIDFFTELYKSLDIEENNNKTDEDNDKCLISNQALVDKFVTMNCGHKFNYIPLYYDLVNHKHKFNIMESSSSKLSGDEIRCPYCRKKQKTLLPYHEEFGLNKVNGVNYFDPNAKQYDPFKLQKCQYNIPNPNFDETKPEIEANIKFLSCGCFGAKISVYNQVDPSQPINYGDDKYYCYKHKKLMIKKYKFEEKQKAKDEAKLSKQKEKDQAKIAKELEKQKIKDEKQKSKDMAKSLKKKSAENIVLGPSQVVIDTNVTPLEPTTNVGCIQILKTGPNKGKQCGCKINLENLCTRHYKLVHNIIVNN
jgi:hypothetical protein